MPLDAMSANLAPLAQLVHTEDGAALRWDACHRPALTPRQATAALTACVASGGTCAAAAWCLAEVAVAGGLLAGTGLTIAAFVHYARHACDRDVITLSRSHLEVERCRGPRSTREAFDVDWVRIECDEITSGLVRVSQREATVTVGRYLTRTSRRVMAWEIRKALGYCRSQVRW